MLFLRRSVENAPPVFSFVFNLICVVGCARVFFFFVVFVFFFFGEKREGEGNRILRKH